MGQTERRSPLVLLQSAQLRQPQLPLYSMGPTQRHQSISSRHFVARLIGTQDAFVSAWTSHGQQDLRTAARLRNAPVLEMLQELSGNGWMRGCDAVASSPQTKRTTRISR